MSSDPERNGGPRRSDVALRLENISKCFQIYEKPHHRLLQGVFRGRKKYYREYWALRDISFTVNRGETVGIIGRNGAGKSTLLQLICGTLTPTSGTIEINGRIAALLELGAGFNPEFTGRENVFLNGAVLGLPQREIHDRFDEIASFADIGDFMEQPVKTYSSGMYVRLAFAVATCVDPDILVVDEALAVGDVKFQAKCFRRFKELVAEGTTILFVTHSTEQIVRHCSWSVLLEQAVIREMGDSKKVSNHYLDLLFGVNRRPHEAGETRTNGIDKEAPAHSVLDGVFENRPTYNKDEYRWGNGEAEIVDYLVTRDGTMNLSSLQGKEPFFVVIAVIFHVEVINPIFGLTIKTPDGVTICGENSRDCVGGPVVKSVKKGERVQVQFSIEQYLCSGHYLLSVGVSEEKEGELVPLDRRYDAMYLHIESDKASYGIVDFRIRVVIK
ncbi:ABC transporter ATP-binding protein [Myxococcota bacterium]|nr:ABC transporter ATP-binding protein [Myxococcota bacterium]